MIFIPYGTREQTHRQHFPYITLTLVLINIAVFGIEVSILASSGEAGLTNFLQRYAFVPTSLTNGGIFPGLFTAMFLHEGLLHIAGNMIYLLPFGDNVEDRLGPIRYLIFYLLCGIIASLIFAAFNIHSTVPLVGASGAIAGVLGGYLALHPRGAVVRGLFFIIIFITKIELPAVLFIGYWFIMQLFSSVISLTTGVAAGQTGGVAFLAHVGGFIAGLILAPLLATSRPGGDQTPQFSSSQN